MQFHVFSLVCSWSMRESQYHVCVSHLVLDSIEINKEMQMGTKILLILLKTLILMDKV